MATKFDRSRILLMFVITLFHLGRCNIKIFGLMNENVTLSPSVHENFEAITWKKGKDKVAEWRLFENDVTYFAPLEGRAILDPKSGKLTLLNLIKSDEGPYEFESSSLNSESRILHVVEKLPQPKISCSSDKENITVECSAPENSDFLNYTWMCPIGCVNISVPTVQLKIIEVVDEVITCWISNPKSTNKSEFSLKECIPKHHSEKRYYISIGIILAFLIIVFIIYKKTNGRIMPTCTSSQKQESIDMTETAPMESSQNATKVPECQAASTPVVKTAASEDQETMQAKELKAEAKTDTIKVSDIPDPVVRTKEFKDETEKLLES